MENRTEQGKTTIDGIGIYWEKYGKGSHVALCIAGTLGDVKADFHPVWKMMDAARFTLVGMDLPGYGNSRPPTRDYCMEEPIYIRDAHLAKKLMGILGYERYSIIGQSGGGLMGIAMAGLFPEKVQKVVACNAPNFEPDRHLVQMAASMTNLNNWPPYQKEHFLKTYGRVYTETVLKSWAKFLADEVATWKHVAVGKEISEKIVETPILYIRGKLDIVLSADTALKIKQHIPHMRILEVDGRHSHLSFLPTFVELTQKFLLD